MDIDGYFDIINIMIYFVRHGESEANIRKVFAGQREDSLLTKRGEEQALETAREIIKEGIKIDRIISSPLRRANKTAQVIADELNISEVEINESIIEYDMGTLSGQPWGKITSTTMTTTEEAEDITGFYNRVYSFVKDLSKLPENILLVSHGGVGRILQSIKENGDPSLFYDLPVYPNASVKKIDWIK